MITSRVFCAQSLETTPGLRLPSGSSSHHRDTEAAWRWSWHHRDVSRQICVTPLVTRAHALVSTIVFAVCNNSSRMFVQKCLQLKAWEMRKNFNLRNKDPFQNVCRWWMNECCDIIQELNSVMIKYFLIHKLSSSCHKVSKLFCFHMTLLTFFWKINKNIYIKFNVKTNRI